MRFGLLTILTMIPLCNAAWAGDQPSDYAAAERTLGTYSGVDGSRNPCTVSIEADSTDGQTQFLVGLTTLQQIQGEGEKPETTYDDTLAGCGTRVSATRDDLQINAGSSWDLGADTRHFDFTLDSNGIPTSVDIVTNSGLFFDCQKQDLGMGTKQECTQLKRSGQ